MLSRSVLTAGLAENNGSLLPGDDFKGTSAGLLPVHRDQLRAQRSVTSLGELYLLPYFSSLVEVYT